MNISRSIVGVLLFACMALSLAGCATVGADGKPVLPKVVVIKIPLAVYSLAAPDIDSKGKNYIITSAMPDLGDDDLEFLVGAKYVKNALAQRGYTLVDSKEKADQEVRLAYGVGEAKTTTSTTATPGYAYPVGWWWNFVPPIQQTSQTTIYTASIVLAAYDLKTPGKLPQVWKTTLGYDSAWDRTPKNSMVLDLIPNMITPAVEYLATNKGKVSIYLYDRKCQAVEDIMK